MQHAAVLTSTKHGRRMRKDNDMRQAAIEQIRKDISKLTDGEVMEKLEGVFELYCDPVRCTSRRGMWRRWGREGQAHRLCPVDAGVGCVEGDMCTAWGMQGRSNGALGCV